MRGRKIQRYTKRRHVYEQNYHPAIFVQSFDGIDRANHLVATYYMDDELPGVDLTTTLP
jgi:hypothetical protein